MRIGMFCSGGDAPGMNACMRAVVRTALVRGHSVVGIRRGYEGLLEEDFFAGPEGTLEMSLRSVSGWTQFGGTFLLTSRSERFRTEEGLRTAADVLRRHRIDALIPIGGDGTFRGALALAQYWDGRIVGCPGTIDNDLVGTDATIGFYTAVQTAVEAVDKIRDTAASHSRMFLIEVMGRSSGFLAVHTAIAAGAEVVCIPEVPLSIEELVEHLKELKQRGKTSVMAVVAEGYPLGGATVLQQKLAQAGCPFATRAVVLGHLQRGGSPTPEDRILATQLGCWAVEGLDEGQHLVMAGIRGGQKAYTPMAEAVSGHNPIPPRLIELIRIMAH
jgi:6-phosphofructokinase 1